MSFDLILPAFFPYLSIASLVCMGLCIFLFWRLDVEDPKKEPQKKAQIYIFLSFFGFLLLSLPALPISLEFRMLLLLFSFSWFCLLPFFFFLVFASDNQISPMSRIIFAVLILIFLTAPQLFPQTMHYMVVFLFFPGLVAAFWIWINLYEKSFIMGRRRMLYHMAAAQLISGAGLLFEQLFPGYVQEIPLLTMGGVIWSNIIIVDAGFKKEDKDPGYEETVSYIQIPLMIIIMIGLYKLLNSYLSDKFSPVWAVQNHNYLAMTLAFICACFYFPTERLLGKLVSSLIRYSVSPFHKAVINLEESEEKLIYPSSLEHFFEEFGQLSYFILQRSRNSPKYRLYQNAFHVGLFAGVESAQTPGRQVPTQHGIKCGSVLKADEKDKGSVTLKLDTQQQYKLKKHGFFIASGMVIGKMAVFSEKACKGLFIENRNYAFIRVDNPPPGPYLPRVFFLFSSIKEDTLEPEMIRNFFKLGRLFNEPVGKTLEEREKRIDPDLGGIGSAENIDWLAEMLKKSLSGFLNNDGLYLLFKNENGSGKLPFSLPIFARKDEEFLDEAGLIKWKIETNNKTGRLLLIKTEAAELSIIFIFSNDELIYEPADIIFLKKLSSSAAFAMDKINLYELLGKQRNELKDVQKEYGEILKKEKMRLASDIHDTIAQELFAASLQINLIEKDFQDTPPRTSGELETLKSVIREAQKHSRGLINKLRSKKIAAREPVGDLLLFINRVGAETGISFKILGLNLLANLDKNMASEISLILREAVNNIRKHSGAKHAFIRFKRLEKKILLLVIDDGKGFNKAKAKAKTHSRSESFGLTSMFSRCERLKGKFHIRTGLSQGTALLFQFPLDSL